MSPRLLLRYAMFTSCFITLLFDLLMRLAAAAAAFIFRAPSRAYARGASALIPWYALLRYRHHAACSLPPARRRYFRCATMSAHDRHAQHAPRDIVISTTTYPLSLIC